MDLMKLSPGTGAPGRKCNLRGVIPLPPATSGNGEARFKKPSEGQHGAGLGDFNSRPVNFFEIPALRLDSFDRRRAPLEGGDSLKVAR